MSKVFTVMGASCIPSGCCSASCDFILNMAGTKNKNVPNLHPKEALFTILRLFSNFIYKAYLESYF
jgi:hypothetical protein